MEELKVNKVVICKQGEDSENYQTFKKIVVEEKIKVIMVKKRRWTNNWKRLENSNFMAKERTNSGKYFKQQLNCSKTSL